MRSRLLKIQANRMGSLSRSPSPESIIADGMERLWKQSQGMINDRLTCIHQALAAAQRNQLDHTLALNSEAAAHKLVGSLGMFGGDRGSVLAKEVESWFEQARSKSPLSVTILEQIQNPKRPKGKLW
jgi:HPt (histidine-containing phosphotransfer) domain-containing protein